MRESGNANRHPSCSSSDGCRHAASPRSQHVDRRQFVSGEQIDISADLRRAQIGGLILDAAVTVLVEEEPIESGAAGQLIVVAVVMDRGAGEEDVAVSACRGAATVREVGDPFGVTMRGGPLGEYGGQSGRVRVEVGAAGDEDIVAGVADDAVAACATDEHVAAVAADEEVIAGPAQEDVVAGAALELIVTR